MNYQVVPFLLAIGMRLVLTEARNHEEPVCSKYDFEEKLLERLVRLEHKLELHHTQLKGWEDKMKIQFTEINDAEIKRTNTITTQQTAIHQELEGQQAKLGEVLTDFQQQVVRLSNELMEKEAHSNKTIQTFLNKKDQIVFFSVDSPTRSLVNGVPLFTGTNANVGGGYDTATGRFTCRIPGMYHFSVTYIASSSNGHVSCYIRQNSTPIVTAYTSTVDSRTYQSASVSTYLSLARGDTVDLSSCTGWNKVNRGAGSMFTGALITPV